MNKEKISKKMEKAMEKDFISVNEHKNPIMKDLQALSYEQKIEALSQYSIFPKNIISMLVNATYTLSYYSWDNVVEELTQNVCEEMGLGDGQIAEFSLPHYVILRKVIMEGFDIDINGVKPNTSTSLFIERVRAVLNNGEPAFICGGVYALESSAIPELSLIKKMAVSALEDQQKEPSRLMLDFFNWHINEIEIEHRDRLLNMADKHIHDDSGWSVFEQGFRAVMTIMDMWWNGLSMEVNSSEHALIDEPF